MCSVVYLNTHVYLSPDPYKLCATSANSMTPFHFVMYMYLIVCIQAITNYFFTCLTYAQCNIEHANR